GCGLRVESRRWLHPLGHGHRLSGADRGTAPSALCRPDPCQAVLHLVQPLRLFRTHQHRFGSGYTIAPRSRFLPDDILPLFTRRAAATPEAVSDTLAPQPAASVDIGARLRGIWG